jgi:hypothetical protein
LFRLFRLALFFLFLILTLPFFTQFFILFLIFHDIFPHLFTSVKLHLQTLLTFHPFNLFLQKLRKRRFIKQALQPNPIHLQTLFPIFQDFAQIVRTHSHQPRLLKQSLNFFLLKVIHTNSIILHIEVLSDLPVSLGGKVDLPKIIATIIPEVQKRSRTHPFRYLASYIQVFLWHNGRENKYES